MISTTLLALFVAAYFAIGILVAALLRRTGHIDTWDGQHAVTFAVIFWPLWVFSVVCNVFVEFLVDLTSRH